MWYDDCPAESVDSHENVTDTEGRTHRDTLPMGKMNPNVWQKQKDYAARVMTPCFLELVNKTKMPFVSTIRDRVSDRALFLEGKVLFVGEALTLMRPHSGKSFNLTAISCLALQKVFEGELRLWQWEVEVLQWAEWHSLTTTAFGILLVHGWWSPAFFLSALRLVSALIRQIFVKLLLAKHASS